MFVEHLSAELALVFILYGITGAVPLVAAVYLLLRQGNAFAPDITPPVRLRRWAASFFAASALGHVWWYLFYIHSHDTHSVSYLTVVVLDCVGMLTTIAGTQFSMLQDRERPIWPVFVAMIPFMVFEILQMCYPDGPFTNLGTAYVLVLYVLFSVYIAFAVRRYGRWLNDNYADLENKKVWLSQTLSLVFLLLFILYELVDTYIDLIFLLHIIELVFFALLLWRVETLPQIDTAQTQQPLTIPANIDFAQIERLLADHCVATHLYLQHDLSLHQLSQAIGTNRSYLSQYFSSQGVTYNTYINHLRINYFIDRYQETISTEQPPTVQQLACESGYRSYSTFSLAFKKHTGHSVMTWIHESGQNTAVSPLLV